MTVVAAPAPAVLLPAVSRAPTPFAQFLPTNLMRLRDGGTMLLDGQLNRSVNARVRYDGAFASPTRGQFFVELRGFSPLGGGPIGLEPARGGERPMTKNELFDLRRAITRFMAQTPGAKAEYADFKARIDEALGQPGPSVDVAKIPTSIVGPNASGSVQGSFFLNAMPGPNPSRTVTASASIQGAGFNDAPPKFGVQKIEVYEAGTNRLVATFNNPKGTDTGRIGRGVFGMSYDLKLDASKMDPSKRYAFVFTSSVNGSAPKQVRSEFLPVDLAY